ncbi:MAG: hypothetical protein OXT09_19920, partial [Myxococcales bacterium]|nr:hypothetical protein [Myxococcales bacterium]
VLPEGNFRADCSTDADCDQPYSCLQSRAFGVPGRTICSLPCTIDADCPFAFNEHCGELTLCENGVCSLLGCM